MNKKVLLSDNGEHILRVMDAIGEYGSNELPHQFIYFYVITKDDHLKIYSIISNLLEKSFKDILDIIAENERIKTIVGPITKKYGMVYYETYLKDHNIKYDFEKNNEGRIVIFY